VVSHTLFRHFWDFCLILNSLIVYEVKQSSQTPNVSFWNYKKIPFSFPFISLSFSACLMYVMSIGHLGSKDCNKKITDENKPTEICLLIVIKSDMPRTLCTNKLQIHICMSSNSHSNFGKRSRWWRQQCGFTWHNISRNKKDLQNGENLSLDNFLRSITYQK